MSQSIGLFRPEVVAQQRLRLWGEVGLALPISGRLLTAVLVLVVGGTVTFLAQGEYHRKEHVRGVLRAAHGTWRVQAESPGVVAAVLVHPGSLVRAGQPLVRLHSVSKLPDGRAEGLPDHVRRVEDREDRRVDDRERAVPEVVQAPGPHDAPVVGHGERPGGRGGRRHARGRQGA